MSLRNQRFPWISTAQTLVTPTEIWCSTWSDGGGGITWNQQFPISQNINETEIYYTYWNLIIKFNGKIHSICWLHSKSLECVKILQVLKNKIRIYKINYFYYLLSSFDCWLYNKSTQETRRTWLSRLILHKETPRRRINPKNWLQYELWHKIPKKIFYHKQKLNWQ